MPLRDSEAAERAGGANNKRKSIEVTLLKGEYVSVIYLACNALTYVAE